MSGLQRAVAITGNPVDGITVIGPFDSHDEAIDHVSYLSHDWWVTDLEAPPCDRHGGIWGDDETCEVCTHEDGTPREQPLKFRTPVHDSTGGMTMRNCQNCWETFDPEKDFYITVHERKGPSVDFHSLACAAIYVYEIELREEK